MLMDFFVWLERAYFWRWLLGIMLGSCIPLLLLSERYDTAWFAFVAIWFYVRFTIVERKHTQLTKVVSEAVTFIQDLLDRSKRSGEEKHT